MPTETAGHFRRIGAAQFGTPEFWWSEDAYDCRELLNEHFRSKDVQRSLFEDVNNEFMYTIVLN
jgi:hypothetical protein